MRFLLALTLFAAALALFDRKVWKANGGFSISAIEAPLKPYPTPHTPFPKELLAQPFYYLGRGSQSFVFASEDGSAVLKFYRFPSHLRKIAWTHHPLGYLFSSRRKKIAQYNERKLNLSFHSFCLAAAPLAKETGVLYVHLEPTSHLSHTALLVDKLGVRHHIPLDPIAFVVQTRAAPFLPAFKSASLPLQKQMLSSLINLISRRCAHGITDLDNMDNNNYGWTGTEAIHLDIGRFQEREDLHLQEEILRVTAPLVQHLEHENRDLLAFYLESIHLAEH